MSGGALERQGSRVSSKLQCALCLLHLVTSREDDSTSSIHSPDDGKGSNRLSQGHSRLLGPPRFSTPSFATRLITSQEVASASRGVSE